MDRTIFILNCWEKPNSTYLQNKEQKATHLSNFPFFFCGEMVT